MSENTNVTVQDELLSTVRRWIRLDPDPVTRRELESLLARATESPEAAEQLDRLFAGRLAFGTAGLRAELGPGPLRMNRLVVRQTAAGLLRYAEEKLAAVDGTAGGARRIVIGYDARHQSDEFAAETARIFADADWEVHIFDRPGPTPLLARQVLVREASVGVMVTASHNPPRDNGYKVYLGGTLSRLLEPHGRGAGAQITAPVDREIATTIEAVVAEEFASSTETPPGEAPEVPSGALAIDDDARDSYREEALELLDPEGFPHRDLTIIYTAMHGVGGEMVTELLAKGGFSRVVPVTEQFAPDPDFPTADFPNPEEPGALDLGLQAAQEHDADLLLANDPDADRLSAAVYDPARTQWRQLSGDEMGALLGAHLLRRGPLRPREDGSPVVMANSIVSSRLLERLCEIRGVGHAATLTGFKWLARVEAMSFGYEEAIGFNVDPTMVKDKDGVSTALIFAELVADLKAAGKTAIDALDEIAAEAGVFITGQVTIKVDDLSQLGQITSGLRAEPPTEIAGSAVVESLDLTKDPLPGAEVNEATTTDALIYLTEQGDRVIVRPSGTEPKVKCYLEAVADTPGLDASADAIAEARQRAADRLAELRESMERLLG
ncbi:phospho-sugar mutase [Nesterenkonia xinjiangensis]|uniref:Phosphomannomutase n=1 Tax=Nesterenkonia xinjiangensis TaxID=225327 RepID=A0A7Z0K7S1_9MICC|nr:phosphomannomutase [Nesterenkonia xinjiangensis]